MTGASGGSGMDTITEQRHVTKERHKRILAGDLSDVPQREQNRVLVFVSSTFTDYAVERNLLTKEAVPALREYCQKYGLEFNLSDMRWGVRDELQDDHNTTALCLAEIKRCQSISRGPYFVCFLGNRYGSRPYPNAIEGWEYKILYNCAKELGKEIELLDEWYYADTNAVPTEYVMQAISSKFPHYNDESEENEELRNQESEEWYAIDSLLTSLFRVAADKAHTDGLISAETRHKYYQSTTEDEIHTGLLNQQNVDSRTLYFAREFNNLNITDKKAKRYKDMVEGEIDEEATDLLNDLKTVKIPSVLDSSNIHHSTVEWTPEGVDEKNEEHAKYLQNVYNFFIDEMKSMVDLHINRNVKVGMEAKSQYQEVLHHSQFVNEKIILYCGRKAMLADIKTRLEKSYESGVEETAQTAMESDHALQEKEQKLEEAKELAKEIEASTGVQMDMEEPFMSVRELKKRIHHRPVTAKYKKPLFISGVSGSGKTSLMSKLSTEIDKWVAPLKPVKIIRFLGTTTKSTYIANTLMSIIQQIWYNYDIDSQFNEEMEPDYVFLSAYLAFLLFRIGTSTKPLYIILEGVDELSQRNLPYNLSWLPCRTPIGVHFILSMVPEMYSILDTAHLLINDETRFITISDLEPSDDKAIFSAVMGHCGRTVSSEQQAMVNESFAECPNPMYVKLVSVEALLWKSYNTPEDCVIGNALISAIDVLFDRLELKHGKILFGKALAYLTACRDGLSDTEMEDVLSLDDEVLQDTYLYHLPYDPEHIRLPPSLWRRIHTDLGVYLITKTSCGKDIANWSHIQLEQAAARRYLTDESRVAIHSLLVEYFEGKWADKVKPLELFKKKKGSYPNAKRGVPPQPLEFCPGKYNTRKLRELALHIFCSNQFEEFLHTVCRSFTWLYAKCKALSVFQVIQDLDTIVRYLQSVEECEDLKKILDETIILCSCLELSVEAIDQDANSLATQILGQFPEGQSELGEGIQALQTQALEWLSTTGTPALIPKTLCLPQAGSEINQILEVVIAAVGDADQFETKVAIAKEEPLVYAVDRLGDTGDIISVYNVDNHGDKMLYSHMPDKDFKSIQLVGDDKFLHCEVYVQRDDLNPTVKKVLLTKNLHDVEYLPDNAEVLCVSKDGNHSFIQVDNKSGSYSAAIDMNTKNELRLKGDYVKYSEALFSHDSSKVVTFNNSEIAVWYVKSGKKLHNLQEQDENMSTSYKDFTLFMHALPGNRLLGRKLGNETSKVLYIWDLSSGEVIKQMPGHSDTVDIISVSQSSKRVVSGTKLANAGDQNYFRVWDLDEGQEIACSKVTGPFSVLTFLGKHEDYIVACTHATKMSVVWQVQDKELVPMYEISGHNERVVFANVTSNNEFLITASVDNTVKVWSLPRIMEKIDALTEKCATMEDMKMNWEEKTESPAVDGEGRTETTCFTVSLDGNKAAVGTANGWVLFYDLHTCAMTKHHRPDNAAVTKILASTNNKYFVTSGTNINVWDAATGELVHQLCGTMLDGERAPASCLAESCNILVVGYAGDESHADVYNLTTGSKIKSILELNGFNQVAITSDAKQIVTTAYDMPIMYDIETGQASVQQNHIKKTNGTPTCVVVSPCDRYVAAGNTEGAIHVLDAKRGKYRFHFKHVYRVSGVAFTSDSKRLVSSGSHNVIIWDLTVGKKLYTLSRHRESITGLSLVCDDRFLVTCSEDKQILVWSMTDGVTLASFYSHSAVRSISVTSDLSTVIYSPENINYLGILQPNAALQAVLRGENNVEVSNSLQTAQALALAFSGEKIAVKTSKSCSIL